MAASESLVSGRDRRSNAGARMSRMLDAEDDDDFYKTTYGGFTEVCDAVLFAIFKYSRFLWVLDSPGFGFFINQILKSHEIGHEKTWS